MWLIALDADEADADTATGVIILELVTLMPLLWAAARYWFFYDQASGRRWCDVVIEAGAGVAPVRSARVRAGVLSILGLKSSIRGRRRLPGCAAGFDLDR
jgi:hypothetical protein